MTKYVDDNFMTRKESFFDDILHSLNNFDDRIQFTFEKSFDHINSLDISLIP